MMTVTMHRAARVGAAIHVVGLASQAVPPGEVQVKLLMRAEELHVIRRR